MYSVVADPIRSAIRSQLCQDALRGQLRRCAGAGRSREVKTVAWKHDAGDDTVIRGIIYASALYLEYSVGRAGDEGAVNMISGK